MDQTIVLVRENVESLLEKEEAYLGSFRIKALKPIIERRPQLCRKTFARMRHSELRITDYTGVLLSLKSNTKKDVCSATLKLQGAITTIRDELGPLPDGLYREELAARVRTLEDLIVRLKGCREA